MHDTIIKGGTVVDGSGGPGFTADVAVKEGQIVEVGRVSGTARETIEADGLLVTPGFIDIHTHYDGQATWDSQLAPSYWHGVTSVIMGNCGVGFAPAKPDKRDWLIGLMEGVEDIPGSALSEGIQWAWESFPEYLDALSRRKLAVNVGAHLAHGALRAYVMGERGAKNEAARPDDIAEMARLVGLAQDAGSFGFSTSRTVVHRAIDGEPVPGTFAAEEELFAIARAIAQSGHGVLECATAGILGEDIIAPPKEMAWMNRISTETGCAMTFLCEENNAQPEFWRQQIAECTSARAKGARVTAQVPARSIGTMVSLAGKFHPFVASPTWNAMGDLPLQGRIARLKADPALRKRLALEGANNIFGVTVNDVALPNLYTWPLTFRIGAPLDYEPTAEQSVEAIAKRNGCDPREVALDILIDNDGRDFLVYQLVGYATGTLAPQYEMLANPDTLVGGSDGGAHVSVICDAAFPTFLLTHWVRDRSRGPRLPLEFIIRKQTAQAAQFYGLKDRGQVKPGFKADLNVIDFARLNCDQPAVVHDLPTGAARLMQKADGYVATFVNGVAVRRGMDDTSARPGGLLRSRA